MTTNKDSHVGGTRSALWLSAACSQKCRDPCFLFHPAASPLEEKTPHLCVTGTALPKGLSLSASRLPFLPPLLWVWPTSPVSPSPWADLSAKSLGAAEAPPPSHCTGTEKAQLHFQVTSHIETEKPSRQQNQHWKSWRDTSKNLGVCCSLSSSKQASATLLGLLPFVFLTESHRSLCFLPFAHPRTYMRAHARIQVSLCPVPTTPMPRCPVNWLCATSISTALIFGFLKGEEVNTAQQRPSNF